MTRPTVLIALFTLLPAISEAAQSTKSVLSEYFRYEQQGPRLERTGKAVSLEICFDTCDYYRARPRTAESDLWDLAFLHQYYFNDAYHLEKFRAQYDAVAKETLRVHTGNCTALAIEELARCVVSTLAARIGAYYAFVRYDEGGRCQMPARLTDPSFLGEASCRKLK